MPKKKIRPVESWWYVLPSERENPPEQQSRFLLRPLSQADRMAVWDDLQRIRVERGDGPRGETTIQKRDFQSALELVVSHLERTENFPLGEPQPWDPAWSEERKRSYLEMLDDLDVYLIGNEIRDHAVVEPAAKNS